jgi:hypothetical protein
MQLRTALDDQRYLLSAGQQCYLVALFAIPAMPGPASRAVANRARAAINVQVHAVEMTGTGWESPLGLQARL